MATEAHIKIEIAVEHGEKRTEAEARAISYRIESYARKVGAEHVLREDYEAQDG